MPANHTSPTFDLRRFRRRVATHVGGFAAALLLSLTVPVPLAPSAGAVQDGRYLEGGNLVVNYTCEGNDAQTDIILGGIGLATFPQQATILSPAVEPSPSPGEEFEMSFTWQWLVDQSLVQTAIAAGTPTLNIASGNPNIGATTGATGSDVIGNPSATLLVLGDGTQAVGYTHGPFTGTFTRTAEVDSPIEFSPGPVASQVVTEGGIALNILCTPQDGDVMTLNDQTGIAPSTTTTTLPEVTTTEATTTTTVDGAVQGGSELPRTGTSSTLVLIVLALGLVDLGFLALSATKPGRAGRPSSAL